MKNAFPAFLFKPYIFLMYHHKLYKYKNLLRYNPKIDQNDRFGSRFNTGSQTYPSNRMAIL